MVRSHQRAVDNSSAAREMSPSKALRAKRTTQTNNSVVSHSRRFVKLFRRHTGFLNHCFRVVSFGKRKHNLEEKLLSCAKRVKPSLAATRVIRISDGDLTSDEERSAPKMDQIREANESRITKEVVLEMETKPEPDRPLKSPIATALEQYDANPVCRLSGFNYKVNARVGIGVRDAKTMLTVVDTGAGPSLIRLGACPKEALSAIDTKKPMANLRSASNHALDVIGVVYLTVIIGTHVAKTPFIVSRNLGADALLGCTYIDYHVDSIRPRRRVIILSNGDTVPIIRRQALRPVTSQLPEPATIGSRAAANFNSIRVARKVTIPARSEIFVEVTTQTSGLRIVEGRNDLWERKKIVTANGVADVIANRPFLVQIANFSSSPVILRKNERVGKASRVPIPGSPEEALSAKESFGVEEEVFDITTLDGPFRSLWEQINAIAFEGEDEPIPETIQEDLESEALSANKDPSFSDISLDHLPPERKARVQQMASAYENLWGPELGKINVSTHKLDLIDNAKPS